MKNSMPGPAQLELSVVIPVCNEEESLGPLMGQLGAVLDNLGLSSEILFIDDGSDDRSYEIMNELKAADERIRIVRFAANAGQSAAFAAGFRSARGRVIATLDADLQNDPKDIPILLNGLESFDMVCGWRKDRRDPWLRKVSSRISNGFRRSVLNDGFHDTACSLRVFRRACVEGLVFFNGMHRFLPFLVKINGFRVGEVVVRHHHRCYGRAKYGLRNRLFKALVDLFGILWLRSRWIDYKIKSEE